MQCIHCIHLGETKNTSFFYFKQKHLKNCNPPNKKPSYGKSETMKIVLLNY